MSKITNNLEKFGELIEANNNTPLVLSNNEDIWWVKQGAIDIFILHSHDGKISEHRAHFIRVEEGHLLFGMKNNKYADVIKILGVGIPNTQIIRIKRDQFNLLLKEDLSASILWIESWINKCNAELTKHIISPKQYKNLLVNEAQILETDEIGFNAQNVIWINSLKGKISWFNQIIKSKPIEINSFPLAHGSWIKAKETSELNIMDTASCIQQGNILTGIDFFHEKLIPRIIKLGEHQNIQETNNLIRKIKSQHKDFDKALHRLVSVVKVEEESFRVSKTGFVLYDTVQVIAKNMGVKITPISHKKLEHHQFLLDEIAKSSNLAIRQVSLTGKNWLQESYLPLLAFKKENNQPVALLPTTNGNYNIIDTQKNTTKPLTKKIAASLQDMGIMFFKSFPSKSLSLKNFLFFGLAGTRKDVYRLFIMGMLAGFFGIAIPYATQFIFNSIIPGNETSQLIQVTVMLVIVTIGIAIFQISNAIALLRIEGKVGVSSQAAIIDRLFSLPAPFFRKFTTGDLAQRSFAPENIIQLMTGTTQTAILGGIFSLFSGLYMFFVNIKLALLASFLVLIALAIFVVMNLKRLSYERHFSELEGVVMNSVFQLLNGIGKIRVAGAEIKAFIAWAKGFGDSVHMRLKASRISNYLIVFNSVFLVLASLIIFAFVSETKLPINTGEFLSFYVAFVQFSASILGMSLGLTSSLNAIPLYERAKPILETVPEVDETKTDPGQLIGEIELSDISFRYSPELPLTLENINIKIAPGEFIALVGPSSSGKSTILRLLLGLEKIDSGVIYYDGIDSSELDIQLVRRQIGVVIQNAKLIPGDILTNIIGSSQATLEDAWTAARIASFDEDIKAMPMGMNTVIGEGISTISGGQRQRLLIARAIVNKPKILLFDEASSALDNITQAIVSKNLSELNATRIMIAHRLSSIISADKIYVLDKGRIVESGTYDELMMKNGHFAELAKRQIAG